MESRRKIITTNAVFLFFSQVIARLATFVASVFLIRYLGVSGFGQYSTVVAYVGMFSVIVDLGLGQLVIREVAQEKKKAGIYLGNFIVLQFFIGFLIFLTLSLVINLFNYPKIVVLATYIYGLSLFITSLSTPFQSLISAFEKMYFNALGNIILSFTTAFLIIATIFKNGGLNLIMTAYSVGAILSLIFLWQVCVRKIVKPDFCLNLNLWKKLLKLAFPFALVSFLAVIYNKVDILMLSKMKDETVVGIYNTAYRLVDIWWIIQIAINNAFFPHLARQYKENITMLKINIKRLAVGQGVIGFLIAFFISFSSYFLINFLFGKKFIYSAELLKILIWYIPLHFIAGSFANTLMAIGKTEKFALAALINVVLVILLNFYLIPQYSYWGTTFTTLLSGFILLFLCGFFVWRERLI